MSRRVFMIVVALSLAGADLAQKAVDETDYHHARSSAVVFVAALLVIGLVALVPRIPSRAALLGAAVATGGALANLISILVWSRGVPDPLVLGSAASGIAFNLADVFVFSGDALMLGAVVLYALRNRAELRLPV